MPGFAPGIFLTAEAVECLSAGPIEVERGIVFRNFFTAALSTALLLSSAAQAAEKVVSWQDEVCSYSVRFDPAKYDSQRVLNTVHLLFGPADFQAPIPPFIDNPQSAAKLDLNQTKQTCDDALAKANALEFLPLKGIDEYRNARIAEIKDSCAFSLAEIKGFQNPSALREYTPATNACLPYIEALEGKSDMPAFFRKTLEQDCKDNASPARCVAENVAKTQKADGSAWMRLYLLNFGWNNCANKFTVRASDTLEPMRANVEKQFKQSFKVRKSKCDDSGD